MIVARKTLFSLLAIAAAVGGNASSEDGGGATMDLVSVNFELVII
jgi:hypothetical protein